jgi:rRNA maturation endonuclease Nob1
MTALALFNFDDGRLFALAVVAVVVAVTMSAIRRPPRRCLRCREINREQAVYCAQCGTKLPEH